MKKLLVAYFLMTALPLLGVFGVLQAGQHLQAPPAIGGEWVLEVTASPDCEAVLIWQQPPILSLSQSGRILHITLNNTDHTTLSGWFDERSMVVQADSNSQKVRIALQVDVNRSEHPEQMIGVLSVADCLDPLWVTGTRLPRSEASYISH